MYICYFVLPEIAKKMSKTKQRYPQFLISHNDNQLRYATNEWALHNTYYLHSGTSTFSRKNISSNHRRIYPNITHNANWKHRPIGFRLITPDPFTLPTFNRDAYTLIM